MRLPFPYVILTISLAVGSVMPPPHAVAQTRPLYDVDPYDRIAVKSDGQVTTHHLVPVESEQKARWRNDAAMPRLLVRLLDYPEQLFEIDRENVVKIEFFEDRLLAEATRLLASGDFDGAFPFFAKLERDYPTHQELPGAVRRFLVQEAKQLMVARKFEAAWLRLDEAHARYRNDEEVGRLLAIALNQQLTEPWDLGNTHEVQRIIDLVQSKYGADQASLLQHWRGRIDGRVQELTDQLRERVEKADYMAASEIALQLRPFPRVSDELASLLLKLEREFPTVRVGVTNPVTGRSIPDDIETAHLRMARLLRRNVTEQAAVGTEGDRYRSPIGALRRDEASGVWRFELEQSDDGSDFRLSQALLRTAQGSNPNAVVLRRLELTTSIDAPGRVTAATARRHLILPALMRVSLHDVWQDPGDSSLASTVTGDSDPASTDVGQRDQAYVPLDRAGSSLVMTANPAYRLATGTQPRQLIEQPVPSTRIGLEQLRAGQLDVLARVFPAEVPSLDRDRQLIVAKYAVPSLHMLVPNSQRRRMAHRTYRRALMYLLDREQILQRTLLAGAELPGCRVVSGPLPAGIRPEDAIAYAYDESIPPRERQLGTGRILLEAAASDLRRADPSRASELDAELRVVHRPDEIAEAACVAICRQWNAAGIQAVRVVLPADTLYPTGDWDLFYQDVTISEPLTDVLRLFTTPLTATLQDPYVRLALRRIEEVADWQTARARLRELHRVLYESLAVLPLWQLQDYAAFRADLSGIQPPLMSLYDTVEMWHRQVDQNAVGRLDRQPEGAAAQ